MTTYLDLGRRRCVRFTLLFDDAGVPFSQYECLGEPLLEGELQDAAESMGVPQPVIAAPGSPRRSETERA